MQITGCILLLRILVTKKRTVLVNQHDYFIIGLLNFKTVEQLNLIKVTNFFTVCIAKYILDDLLNDL